MRLDKLLSHHGCGTRKEVKKLLHSGAVQVNGRVCTAADFHLDAQTDSLMLNGKKLEYKEHFYLMMNKPQNTVCAAKDGLHQTVFDLLEGDARRFFTAGKLHLVGRLDIDTEGLLLFTTDGNLTHRLTSPKKSQPKTYLVHLRDPIFDLRQYEQKFAAGFFVPPEAKEAGFLCKSAQLVLHKAQDKTTADRTLCELTIFEGKYHQVKRMFAVLNNRVVFLKRLAIGNLKLDSSLALGQYRELNTLEKSILTES